MRNLALGIMGSWALFMLRKAKLTAMKLGILLTSIISLGVRQKLALAVCRLQDAAGHDAAQDEVMTSEPACRL